MFVTVSGNITKNTSWTNKNTYVIVGEVHVVAGVTLTIANNTQVFIRNGTYPTSTIKKSALIFDTGSALSAGNVYVKASNNQNVGVGVADNGGVWFVGSAANVDKDGISASFNTKQSNFVASKIFTYFLGSKDPVVKKAIPDPSADQDSVTVLGVGSYEWNVQEIIVSDSGDNAIDVVESYVDINNLNVTNPGEDAVNVQSGKVNVLKRLRALVPLSIVRDRDIFDFEADNGISSLRIANGVKTELLGIFGDQLDLVSDDLPQPTNFLYYFNGTTSKGQSYIYAGLPPPPTKKSNKKTK